MTRPRTNRASLYAGWLFADLLLVLGVIGLSALTSAKPRPPENSNLSCRPFLFRFEDAELRVAGALGSRFEGEVSDTLQVRRIPNGKPGIVLLFGGYDANESVVAGQRRAQDAEATLRAASQQLATVPIRMLGARVVDGQEIGSRGKFGLLIYFVYSGADSLGQCTVSEE